MTYGQLCTLIGAIDLPEAKKQELIRRVLETGKKLEAVKYHRDNCVRLIASERPRIPQGNGTNEEVVTADITTGIEKEAEAFILQGKSCLDVLVKIFEPLLNIKLHSFGESGDQVIQVLQNNLGEEYSPRATPLIEMLKTDRDWIHQWFKMERDSLDHYRALRSTGITVIHSRDGREVVIPPQLTSGIPLKTLVEGLYENLFNFCEEFLVLSYSIKFLKGLNLGIVPEDERRPDLPAKYCAAIRQ